MSSLFFAGRTSSGTLSSFVFAGGTFSVTNMNIINMINVNIINMINVNIINMINMDAIFANSIASDQKYKAICIQDGCESYMTRGVRAIACQAAQTMVEPWTSRTKASRL